MSLPPEYDWRLWVYGGYSNPGNTLDRNQIEREYGSIVPTSPYVTIDDTGEVVTLAQQQAQQIIERVLGIAGPAPEASQDDLSFVDEPERPLKTLAELELEQRVRFTAITNAMWDIEQDKRRKELIRQWGTMAGKPFSPQNEMGLIMLFGSVLDIIGWKLIDVKPNAYPDGVFLNDRDDLILVEFEYNSSGFIAHKHDARGAHMVICWNNDKVLPLPVVEVDGYYDEKTGAWRFDAFRQALRAASTPSARALQNVA